MPIEDQGADYAASPLDESAFPEEALAKISAIFAEFDTDNRLC